jgi:lysophospholipase L1-like esterase
MTEPSRSRSRRGTVLLALASLAVSLVLCEALLRWLRPLPDPYVMLKAGVQISWPGTAYVPSAYPPHYTREVFAEPGLPGIDRRPRRFTIDNLGYRGDSLAMPKPAGEVRIFMVGGSTTECVFLDDSEAVTRRLQDRLRAAYPGVDIRVYGAGKSGDKSWDHVAMVTHRIAHLQPDVVIVFAGFNDFLSSVLAKDYLLRGDTAPGRRVPSRVVVRMATSELQLYRLAHAALHRFDPAETTIHSQYRQAARKARARREVPLPAADPTPFEENLRTLVGAIQAQGARAVLMTQASSWNSPDPVAAQWHWMTGHPERFPERDLDAGLGRFNARTRAVGAELGAPVADLAAALPRRMDYFYDDVHFNVLGADRAAALLAETLVRSGAIRRARPR